MRVGEEESAADRTYRGKHQGGVKGGDPAVAHAPFENSEDDDQEGEQTVLHDFGDSEALPEASGPQGPVLRIGTQEEEDCQRQKHERPVPRPACCWNAGERRQQTRPKHDETRPMVVVLRPCDVCRRAWLVGGSGCEGGRTGGSAESERSGWRQRRERRRLEPRPCRMHSLANFG